MTTIKVVIYLFLLDITSRSLHMYFLLQKIFDNIMNRNITWPLVPEEMSYEANDLICKYVPTSTPLSYFVLCNIKFNEINVF